MLNFIMPYLKILIMSIAPIIIFIYVRREIRDRQFNKAMDKIETVDPFNTRASINYDSVVIYYREHQKHLNDSI